MEGVSRDLLLRAEACISRTAETAGDHKLLKEIREALGITGPRPGLLDPPVTFKHDLSGMKDPYVVPDTWDGLLEWLDSVLTRQFSGSKASGSLTVVMNAQARDMFQAFQNANPYISMPTSDDENPEFVVRSPGTLFIAVCEQPRTAGRLIGYMIVSHNPGMPPRRLATRFLFEV